MRTINVFLFFNRSHPMSSFFMVLIKLDEWLWLWLGLGRVIDFINKKTVNNMKPTDFDNVTSEYLASAATLLMR